MSANPSELVLMGGNPSYVGRATHGGKRYIFEYKTSFGKRYYSFDGGRNWHKSKSEAFHSAKNAGRLQQEGTIRQTIANPSSGLAGASQVYEEFHGEPGKHVDTYIEPEPRPANLGQLGVLVELQVKRDGGWKWGILDFTGKDVQVAGNVGHSQIYFVGGDQKITRGQLTHLGVDNSKEMLDLGECMIIAYRAKKMHVDGIASDYEHKFGDATGRRPRLMYDRRGPQGRLFLVGGEYTIEPEGIVN